jgi:hypothetical protein
MTSMKNFNTLVLTTWQGFSSFGVFLAAVRKYVMVTSRPLEDERITSRERPVKILFLLPDEEESVNGESRVGNSLVHERPLRQNPKILVVPDREDFQIGVHHDDPSYGEEPKAVDALDGVLGDGVHVQDLLPVVDSREAQQDPHQDVLLRLVFLLAHFYYFLLHTVTDLHLFGIFHVIVVVVFQLGVVLLFPTLVRRDYLQ